MKGRSRKPVPAKKPRKLTGAAARSIVLRLVAAFPGFVTDEDTNGGDVVEWIGNEIHALMPDAEIRRYAHDGSPDNMTLRMFR